MTASEIECRCNELAATGQKPTLPEVRRIVDAFYALPNNGAGGSLHCVLDDGNWQRCFVESSIVYANERNDQTGAALARVLLLLSNSQRRKL